MAAKRFTQASPQEKRKILKELEDKGTFYNHGDNPLYKNLATMMLNNKQYGGVIDQRSHLFERGQKTFRARHFDDLLQRDFKVNTFERALFVLGVNTVLFCHALKMGRSFFPVGSFGIRSITQTPVYHHFGPIGVAGVFTYLWAFAYAEWRTLRFTAEKFYVNVILNERDYMGYHFDNLGWEDYRYNDSVFDSMDKQELKTVVLNYLESPEANGAAFDEKLKANYHILRKAQS